MSLLDRDHFDFKHAVVLIWREDGRPVKETPRSRRLAYDLLREWGKARSGVAVWNDTEKWDFGRYTGYAMFFTGPLGEDGQVTQPSTSTRLTGDGRVMDESLRGVEERYEITQADLDAIGPTDDVGVVVAGNRDSAYLSVEDIGRLRDEMIRAGMVPIRLVSNILARSDGRYYICFSDPTALLDALEPEETLVCFNLGMGSDSLPLYGWTTSLIADL